MKNKRSKVEELRRSLRVDYGPFQPVIFMEKTLAVPVGTYDMFFCTFVVAFLFNWVGCLTSLCIISTTVAGRCGALSGLGLSIVKWMAIAKLYNFTLVVTPGVDMFLWILTVYGAWFLFIYGIVRYEYVKYLMKRHIDQPRKNRLVYSRYYKRDAYIV